MNVLHGVTDSTASQFIKVIIV